MNTKRITELVPPDVEISRREVLVRLGLGVSIAYVGPMVLTLGQPAHAGGEGGGGEGGGGGNEGLSIGGESSGQLGVAFNRAVEAVQTAGLGQEKETQLLNMLEQGRKVYAKSRIENNRRQAAAYEAEAMSILEQVTAIVADSA